MTSQFKTHHPWRVDGTTPTETLAEITISKNKILLESLNRLRLIVSSLMGRLW
jgi:hypothetical protein